MTIPRPGRWTLLRVVVLSHLGAWVLPMPWQQPDPPYEPPPVGVQLGPATLDWLAGRDPTPT